MCECQNCSRCQARRKDLELSALYVGGATLQEIGNAIGVSRERVRQRVTRARMDRRSRKAFGWHDTKNWVAKERAKEQQYVAREKKKRQIIDTIRKLYQERGQVKFADLGQVIWGIRRRLAAQVACNTLCYLFRPSGMSNIDSTRNPNRKVILHSVFDSLGIPYPKAGRPHKHDI